ncbi:MAG: TonB family protein [Candidatus Fermentibacteraceae bacterium]|nr:TonB family protein [Candidatus Fermentibacteraceae bacterium]
MRHSRNISKAGAMDYGTVAGIVLLILIFEVIPGTRIGRLAAKTVESEMQGFDPGELYEIPPELQEDTPIDIENIFQNEIPDVVQPELVISLSTDTAGLSHASTVQMNNLVRIENPDANTIPNPGTFIPHSVPPVCTFRPVPEYPDMARQAGVEGRVILQVFVSAEGKPVQVVITQSSGLGSMDESAEEAAWNSSWSPARRADNVPVGVWTSVIYNFVLE